MEIMVFDPRHPEKEIDSSVPRRDYVSITLNANTDENKIKLDYARLLMREHKINHDTIHGIHFHFDTTSHYEALVEIQNILLKEKIEHYLMYPTEIWVMEMSASECRDIRVSYTPLRYL